LQLVAEKRRASGNVIFDFLVNCFLSAIRQNLSADFAAALQNSHDDSLIVRATYDYSPIVNAEVYIASFAADESFIYFHFASRPAELHEQVFLQSEPQPMENKPSRLLGEP
jgi:uncharacterized protein (DUF1697 family)